MWHIADPAWKFGCGRYIQKPDAILDLPSEIDRLGNSALIICGKHANEAAFSSKQGLLERVHHRLIIHPGMCSEEAARQYAHIAEEHGLDVIVGVGGGKIMDLAKMTGEFSRKPVINVPTICATCAAYTPLSVLYTEEGKALGSWFFEQEVACILADTRILACQPGRYAFSGIIDSMAKIIEITHNSAFLPGTADIAFAKANAQYLFDRLRSIAQFVPSALHEGQSSPVVDEMVYLTIPVTGMVSGCARGQGQSAIAHAMYESVRSLFTSESAQYLHGEIVGVGLLAQLRYDGLDYTDLEALMARYNMPRTLHELNILPSQERLHVLARDMLRRDMIHPDVENEDRLVAALASIAE